MFKFLKEKLGNWVKNLSKEKEKKDEIEEEKAIETKKARKAKKEEKISKEEEIQKEREVTNKIVKDIEEEQERKKEEELEKEIEEEKKEQKKGFFQRLKEKFITIKISEEDFQKYSEELEMLLLENNVALGVAEKIISELKKNIVNKDIPKKELEKEIRREQKNIIKNILVEPFNLLDKIREEQKNKHEPYIILFCGINGSGKTTTIAKLASFLQKNKLTSVLAAADTFRAASIEQLKKHGENLNIPVISHDYGSDPASVGFDAISYAKKHGIKVVLIDTAGRMHTAKNLLKEMEKIVRVTNPDLKIFVGEAITGNDAVEQAKAFNEEIKIDAIILAKSDVDEKGGTALSVGNITGKPILYLGTGQKYSDLEPFNKEKFLEKLGL